MKIFRVLMVNALVCALLPQASAVQARPLTAPPDFGAFPVTASQATARNGAVKLHLTTRFTRRYWSVLHEEFQEAANFAGHYRVAIWGCGTDCRMFAILDKNTGTAYTLPNVELIAGVMGNDEDRIAFRIDSRLLVIAGELNDDDTQQGKFYYIWTGQRLKRIYTAKLAVEPIDTAPVRSAP
ncbi:hypothetical protein [Burkholderia sp. Ax-1719]|uniref:hypothetical protein n=1 Tax=Burkholderia sp. Ax-1719 TaxID=2608334 RepID=UPI0014222618|nr:hypothetical protein [Burkholderia sp. Ax-1719]NIE67376.1 hypothetical protein [Burkholderia sp. Ax-1719]